MTRDTLDPDQQQSEAQSEELKARRKQLRQIDDIKWLVAHPQGRRIAARLLDHTGLTAVSFNTNAMVMAHNEGARKVGVFLMEQLQLASPEGYIKILKEQGNE